jgi:hypothetical protein
MISRLAHYRRRFASAEHNRRNYTHNSAIGARVQNPFLMDCDLRVRIDALSGDVVEDGT